MPADNYVKFGETPGKPREPYIKGDCTDDDHLDWCELRGSGFEVAFPDEEKSGDDASKSEDKQTVTLKPVSLTKRVDWASTQLFEKCCEAGKAKIAKSKEERDVGTIDKVTVEVCKYANGKKFAFMVIEYSGVRITNFSINMNGPEPQETIVFEYDKFEFKYQPTNPYTGAPEGALLTTATFEGRKEKDDAGTPATTSGTSSSGSGSGSTGGTATAATAATAVATVASGGGTRASANLSSAVDAGLSANFPGVLPSNGLGLLPD